MNWLIGRRVKYIPHHEYGYRNHDGYYGLTGTVISCGVDPNISEFFALVLFDDNNAKSIYFDCLEFIPDCKHIAGGNQ